MRETLSIIYFLNADQHYHYSSILFVVGSVFLMLISNPLKAEGFSLLQLIFVFYQQSRFGVLLYFYKILFLYQKRYHMLPERISKFLHSLSSGLDQLFSSYSGFLIMLLYSFPIVLLFDFQQVFHSIE